MKVQQSMLKSRHKSTVVANSLHRHMPPQHLSAIQKSYQATRIDTTCSTRATRIQVKIITIEAFTPSRIIIIITTKLILWKIASPTRCCPTCTNNISCGSISNNNIKSTTSPAIGSIFSSRKILESILAAAHRIAKRAMSNFISKLAIWAVKVAAQPRVKSVYHKIMLRITARTHGIHIRRTLTSTRIDFIGIRKSRQVPSKAMLTQRQQRLKEKCWTVIL